MKLKYQRRLFLIPVLLSIFCEISSAQSIVIDTIKNKDKTEELKNTGYGTQASKFVTGSISVVKGSSIEQNFNTNLGNALYGRLAGLTVSQGNSEPGVASPGLLSRGRNNFNSAASSPLIIVDGFIGGGSGIGSIFSSLVPEEIESITLLKDAVTTAVYGSRAANGVLLVTTKRGVPGGLRIDFSTKQGFSQAQQLPEFLDAGDYAVLNNEARRNDGLAELYNQAAITGYRAGDNKYLYPNVNWYDEVLRKSAPVSNYNLNLTGGDNNVRYFVLLNAVSNAGLFKNFGDMDPESSNSKYNRYNFRTNIDLNLSKRLAVVFNIGGSIENKVNPWEYTTANTFNLIQSLPANAFPVRNSNGSFGGNNLYSGNPVANLLATGYDQSNGRTLQTSLRAIQQLDMITKGLSASGVVSINNYVIAGSEKNKTYERFPSLGSLDSQGNPNLGLAIGTRTSLSVAEITRNQYRNFEVQGSLNYARVFGNHSLSALLMINTDNEVRDISNTPNNGALSDPYRHNGSATRITYVYGNKYIGEFSAGYMGSENFAPGRRYGFFPAGSIGWILSGENFLRNNKSINFLKVRGSFGLTGNDNIGGNRYPYVQEYSFNGIEGTIANPLATWEKEKNLNLGFDATLFDILDVNFDIFKRNRFDQLISSTAVVPNYVGATASLLNLGKSSSQGLEVSVRLNSKPNQKFNYYVETNFSYYKNKNVYSGQIPQLNNGLVNDGQLIGQPLRLRAIGFFTPEEIEDIKINPGKYPTRPGVSVQAGDLKYEDIGGSLGFKDGIIDENDRVPVGKPGVPNVTLGLATGFQFKGFDLNVVFQAVTGNSVYLTGSLFQAFQNNGSVTPIALGRWTPQTASSATYPRLSSVNNLNNFEGSSFWDRDASFIKLRSAELGYTLPEKISSKVKIGSARLFVTGTNLFSLDRIEYGDPESLGGYPVLRTLVIGTKIKLW